MSKKLVYIDSVKDCLNRAYGEGNLLGLDKVLDDVPAADFLVKSFVFGVDLCKDSDFAEVVRCKDCKWWHHIGCSIDTRNPDDIPKETDFCSFGERREV